MQKKLKLNKALTLEKWVWLSRRSIRESCFIPSVNACSHSTSRRCILRLLSIIASIYVCCYLNYHKSNIIICIEPKHMSVVLFSNPAISVKYTSILLLILRINCVINIIRNTYFFVHIFPKKLNLFSTLLRFFFEDQDLIC